MRYQFRYSIRWCGCVVNDENQNFKEKKEFITKTNCFNNMWKNKRQIWFLLRFCEMFFFLSRINPKFIKTTNWLRGVRYSLCIYKFIYCLSSRNWFPLFFPSNSFMLLLSHIMLLYLNKDIKNRDTNKVNTTSHIKSVSDPLCPGVCGALWRTERVAESNWATGGWLAGWSHELSRLGSWKLEGNLRLGCSTMPVMTWL